MGCIQSSQRLDESRASRIWHILFPQGKGALYCALFTCAHATCQRLSTTSNVLDSTILTLIMRSADILQGRLASQVLQGQEVDLVLDIPNSHGTAAYYYVSHVEQCIYWLEGIGLKKVDISCPLNKGIRPLDSRVHRTSVSSGIIFAVTDRFTRHQGPLLVSPFVDEHLRDSDLIVL